MYENVKLKKIIIREWHHVKNGSLRPEEVKLGSGKKVWWICSKGHVWQTRIVDRKKHACPYCSGRFLCRENSLHFLKPEIAKEWHPTNNGKLTSRDVSLYSHKKAWWACKNGHSWEAVIYSRASGKGCPYCSGKVVSNERSLAVKNPRLAREWHPTKNGDLTPYKVTAFSNKEAWWKCADKHVWKSRIANRKKCPVCI